MCNVLLSFLCHFPSLSLSTPPDSHWVSSVTRISRAALVAARHACRRPRAVRRCGPLSIRTHQDFCHHVMCLFDTWFFFLHRIRFSSFFNALFRVVPSPSSCPPWAFTLLSCLSWASVFLFALLVPREPLSPSLAILALPEPSLLFSLSCSS